MFGAEDGSPQGITNDYVKILRNKMGLELTDTIGPWNKILNQTHSGGIDVLPNLNATERRRDFLAFSKPFCAFRLF
jgi:hypothetical protein